MSSTSVASKTSPAGPPGHAERRHPKPRRPGTPWRQLLAPVLLVVPMLAALLAVSLYPVLWTIWMAFRNTSLETQGDRFTGLANVRHLASDAMFWKAWRQTCEFTVVTARMFSWLFDQGGLVNYLLVRLHLVAQPVNFLGSTTLALPTLMVADIWKTTPFMALLLLAGLQTIPPDLAEAARIDGASAWGYFRRIRLPLLLPTLLVPSLLRALDAFRVFDLPYVVTGGGPASSTQTMSTYAYNTLFSGLELGYGSTIATAMFVTELIIAGVFGLFIVRRLRQEA